MRERFHCFAVNLVVWRGASWFMWTIWFMWTGALCAAKGPVQGGPVLRIDVLRSGVSGCAPVSVLRIDVLHRYAAMRSGFRTRAGGQGGEKGQHPPVSVYGGRRARAVLCVGPAPNPKRSLRPTLCVGFRVWAVDCARGGCKATRLVTFRGQAGGGGAGVGGEGAVGGRECREGGA